jgi:hypothetical protein
MQRNAEFITRSFPRIVCSPHWIESDRFLAAIALPRPPSLRIAAIVRAMKLHLSVRLAASKVRRWASASRLLSPDDVSIVAQAGAQDQPATLFDSVSAALFSPGGAAKPYVFKKIDDTWVVRFGREGSFFNDYTDLQLIHEFLAHPWLKLSVLDLAGGGHMGPTRSVIEAATAGISATQPAVTGWGFDPVLDREARKACTDRMEELEAEIEEARANNEEAKLARPQEESNEIAKYLNAATRPGGGSKPLTGGDPIQKAYEAVKRAKNRAIERLRTSAMPLPNLAAHLERTIHYRDGAYYYEPAPHEMWPWEL